MPNLLELPPVSLPDLAVALLLGLILSSITAVAVRAFRTHSHQPREFGLHSADRDVDDRVDYYHRQGVDCPVTWSGRRALHRQVSDTHQRT